MTITIKLIILRCCTNIELIINKINFDLFYLDLFPCLN